MLNFSDLMLEDYDQLNKNVKDVVIVEADSLNTLKNENYADIHFSLYTKCLEMSTALNGLDVKSLSSAELKAIAVEHGINDLSIWVKDGDNLKVLSTSTQLDEGLTTEGWDDIWRVPLMQLINHEIVTPINDFGFGFKNFFVGPPAKSSNGEGYFFFSYYNDGTSDFIINPYVSAQSGVRMNKEINKIITKLSAIVPAFTSMTLINAPKLIEYLENDESLDQDFTSESNEDYLIDAMPVIGGDTSFIEKSDIDMIQLVHNSKVEQKVTIRRDGARYTKYFLPLQTGRILMTVFEDSRRFNAIMVTTITSVTTACIMFFIMMLVIRAVSVRQLKPIYQILDYFKKISDGNFNAKLTVEQGNELYALADEAKAVSQKLQTLLQELLDKSDSAMYQLAYYDVLTSLPNRRFVYEKLDKMIANNETVTMLFSDLDGFKIVNDKFGHDIGDKLLQEIAARMKAVVGERGFCGRLGGDEFVVITDYSEAVVADISHRLLSEISSITCIDNHTIKISVSIGIARGAKDMTADELIRLSDAAMYDAKKSGKNRTTFAAP